MSSRTNAPREPPALLGGRRVVLGMMAGLTAAPWRLFAGPGPAPRSSRTRIALGPLERSSLPDLPELARQELQQGLTRRVQLEPVLKGLYQLDQDNCLRRLPPSPELEARYSVRVLQGRRGFDVPRVFGLQGILEQVAEQQQAITIWQLLFDPLPGREVLDTSVRDRVYALAARLRASGWKRFIAPDEPRLGGHHAMEFKISEHDTEYSVDPDWIPDAPTWRRVAGMHPRWHWIADGVHLVLQVHDMNSMSNTLARNPEQITCKQAYSLFLRISTDKRYFGIQAWPRGEAMWQLDELRKQLVLQSSATRKTIEARLRRSSIPILDTYRDPPLPEVS
ncbi:MAG: hypothetical protein KGR99_11115 [Betaproteobacteria bacterium]|nr:hypothetical protein [Betaproteobacteria bacterium]MBU6512843.1 hypothetical protein [Betaproteobacteria bacterium]MDE2152628.1 hypothetical protein [Betaproteobacteria bacterium]